MSIIEMPGWIKRKRRLDQRRPFDPRPGAINMMPDNGNFQIPDDMKHELDQLLEEERRHAPPGTPKRTATTIAQQLEHLREDLTDARAVVKQGEEKESALVIELAKTVDEEIAAKKATHDAEVAALEDLRPATGGSGEGDQTQPL